jgi:hypothetical protein
MTGNEWVWWTPDKPVFDAFDEFKPDLIMTSGKPKCGLEKCAIASKIPWIHLVDGRYIEVKQEGEVFTRELIPPLVDHLSYKPVDPQPHFTSDICYVGPPNDTMVKLCYPPLVNVKIAGSQNWPVVQYIGDLTPQQTLELYASATIVYAETVEDALKATACKRPFITRHDDVAEVWGGEDDCFVIDDIEDLRDMIYMCSTNPTILEGKAEKCYKKSIPFYTHMQYAVDLLANTNYEEEMLKIVEFSHEHR